MRFRPCIDLHRGVVKQIVGGSLSDENQRTVRINFETEKPAQWFAHKYRKDGMTGGHIIQLGPGNAEAARSALAAWPNGFQLGGGINPHNAVDWLEAGAAAVIVTSWVFHDGVLDKDRLKTLVKRIGRRRLVLDLSCRRRGSDYYIVTNRWQTFTREKITLPLLDDLSASCFEFLIHAVDVEGLCHGIELPLVALLGQWGRQAVTYAGGIHSEADLQDLAQMGRGNLDFTVGSALDLFGGHALAYDDLVQRFGPKAKDGT